MRRLLRLLALLLGPGALAYWLATGASTGWSKTSVAVKTLDEVTGIEAIDYRSQFVPGIDFLALSGLAAAVAFGVSLRFRPAAPPLSSPRTSDS